MDVQPCFLLWEQVGQLHPDGHCIGEVQKVVVLWVLDLPDVHLDGHKVVLIGQQVAQKGMPCSLINHVPKMALGKWPKPVKCPF